MTLTFASIEGYNLFVGLEGEEEEDCAGVIGGNADEDDCGICDDNKSNDCITLSIDLQSGANLISFSALPEDRSVENIFSGVNEIISEASSAAFNDGLWVGTLTKVYQDEGYWVIVSSDRTLEIFDAVPISYDEDGIVTYNLDMDAIAKFQNTPDSIRLFEAEAKKEKMLQTGFIAQEVEKAAQKLGYEFSGVDAPKNENDHYGLRYAEFTVPLVKAVQELSQQNKMLKAENKKIQEELFEIKEMLKRSAE